MAGDLVTNGLPQPPPPGSFRVKCVNEQKTLSVKSYIILGVAMFSSKLDRNYFGGKIKTISIQLADHLPPGGFYSPFENSRD